MVDKTRIIDATELVDNYSEALTFNDVAYVYIEEVAFNGELNDFLFAMDIMYHAGFDVISFERTEAKVKILCQNQLLSRDRSVLGE